ncbi:DUF4326 domain-containing protein [Bosea sp. (in: a-proteobacteria)]|uniref:DUF4326 domain-containing protein n=1 Tax=Bosea sp. (in: a-proteobacteria) TaxID=1871050 RepID=UPI003B3BE329
MVEPVRLQLSRRKGFDLQALSHATNGLPAVKVSRPGPWGNPFNFRDASYCWAALGYGCKGDPDGRQEASVRAFREWIDPGEGRRVVSVEVDPAIVAGDKRVSLGPRVLVGPAPKHERVRDALRGRNLACWCKPGTPCHADVLLELANRPVCEAVP